MTSRTIANIAGGTPKRRYATSAPIDPNATNAANPLHVFWWFHGNRGPRIDFPASVAKPSPNARIAHTTAADTTS